MFKLKTSQIGAALALSAGMLVSTHALSDDTCPHTEAAGRNVTCTTTPKLFLKGATVNWTEHAFLADGSGGWISVMNITDGTGTLVKQFTSTGYSSGSFIAPNGRFLKAQIRAYKSENDTRLITVYANLK